MKVRTLQELNLLDDYLFNKLASHPEFGEKFSRELLRIIYQREFGKLKVLPQKIYYGFNVGRHGVRLDVYLEEDEADVFPKTNGTVYDIEPNLNDKPEEIQALPRRTRFYHAIIDANSLKSGSSYKHLKDVVVIMITPYDPFGYNLAIYTIRSCIKELPDAEYNDGAQTIFLNTHGKNGNVSKELLELLRYMECTTEENACNESLRKIHRMVEIVKQDSEVTLEYMKIFEREEMLIEHGIEQGIEQGRNLERKNTDAALKNAETERIRAEKAEKELIVLRELLRKHGIPTAC